jgi:hypothetical protein
MCILDTKRPLSRAGRSLLTRWSVPHKDSLAVAVERENTLVLSGPRGTLYLAQRRCPVGHTAQETRQMLELSPRGQTAGTYETIADGVMKFGHVLVNQPFMPERTCLHAFTITGGEYLELAFYLRSPQDLPWALSLWQKTAFGNQTHPLRYYQERGGTQSVRPLHPAGTPGVGQ